MFKFVKSLLGVKNSVEQKVVEAPKTIFGKSTDLEISELLKKATALKKIDIDEAISCIKQALKLDPNYPCYDKLTNYLISANRMDEAQEVFKSRIRKFKTNDDLFNFQNRASNYERYSYFLFNKSLYTDYIFYNALSIYNSLVASAFGEDLKSIKVILTSLKNKETFTDKRTNKSFQIIVIADKQEIFIENLHRVLIGFEFDVLCKLIIHLNNKQINQEELEIEGYKIEKIDWLLWSNDEFCELIKNYEESIFIDKYNLQLEKILDDN